MSDAMLTQEELKRRLDYDQATGIFTWKLKNPNTKIGQQAGIKRKAGYIVISIARYKVFAHRLAWLYMFGKLPMKFIDHIDGNKSNNKIENLRDVSSSVNQQNKTKPQKNNTSGYMGVSFDKQLKKWKAQIGVNCKHIYIGHFNNPESAYEAYLETKRKLHEGCTI